MAESDDVEEEDDDGYFERMCAAAPGDPRDDLEALCREALRIEGGKEARPQYLTEEGYFDAMSALNKEDVSFVLGEDSLVWQSLLREGALGASKYSQTPSKLVVVDTPTRLHLMSQWLFSHLPLSSMLYCEVQRLAALFTSQASSEQGQDHITCFTDHVQHPSFAAILTQKRSSAGLGDVSFCLFSSLPLASALAVEIAGLIVQLKRKTPETDSGSTELPVCPSAATQTQAQAQAQTQTQTQTQTQPQRIVVAGLDTASCQEPLLAALAARGVRQQWIEEAPLWTLQDLGSLRAAAIAETETETVVWSCQDKEDGFNYEYCFSPLTAADAATVDANWKYRSHSSLDRILDMIASGLPTLCCRYRRLGDGGEDHRDIQGDDKREGELVAWVLTNLNGSIGMLHTLPQHRNRSLAKKLVTRLLPLWLDAGLGVAPFCYITPSNEASMRVFGSLGFCRRLDAAWFGLSFE